MMSVLFIGPRLFERILNILMFRSQCLYYPKNVSIWLYQEGWVLNLKIYCLTPWSVTKFYEITSYFVLSSTICSLFFVFCFLILMNSRNANCLALCVLMIFIESKKRGATEFITIGILVCLHKPYCTTHK